MPFESEYLRLQDRDFASRIDRIESQPPNPLRRKWKPEPLNAARWRPKRQSHRLTIVEDLLLAPIELGEIPRRGQQFDFENSRRA